MATLPHYLKLEKTDPDKMDSEYFMNNSLRWGIVTKVFPPDDPQNTNKQYTEYNVRVNVRNGVNGREVNTVYRCVLANSFGSSDYIKYSLRVDPNAKNSMTTGSAVLILCINGETTNAIIINGLNNGNSGNSGNPLTPVDPSDDIFFQFNFNGVNFNIAEDGSMKVQANGATNIDGTPNSNNPETNHGPLLAFNADGSINIDNNDGSNVNIDAKGNISINSSGNITINADGDTKIGNNAGQQLVQGNNLVDALSAFIDIFVQNAAGFTLPGPSSPAGSLQTPVLQAIAQWKLQYLTSGAFLASDKYTE